MDEATKRNFTTLSEGLKEQRMINLQQTDQIKQLEAKVASLQQQVAAMQVQIAQMMAINMGTGPTSRG